MTTSRTRTVEQSAPEAPVREPTRVPRLPAPAQPAPLSRKLSLAAGNLATQRLLRAEATQPKSIGPNVGRCSMADRPERTRIQRSTRPTIPAVDAVSPHIADRIRAEQGGGAPLPSPVRANLEARLGHNIGDTRVHADGEAD